MCARMLRSSRYVEMEESRVSKNISVKWICRNGGIDGAQEYFG